MKKVFILAIGVLVAGAAQAQTDLNEIKFGIKAGGNFSNIIRTDNSDFKTDFKPGFHAGVFVNIPIIDRLSFAPEVTFSQKGYKSDMFGGTLKQTTNWVEIPVLVKLNATPSFNVFLGPQVSFLTQTQNKFEGSFGEVEQTNIESQSETFKKSIFGAVIGIGYDITPQIGINARYALDLQKNNKNGTTEIPTYKNQVIQAGLSYSF
ncbi:MAG: porin family protein [Daejeonella sp.]